MVSLAGCGATERLEEVGGSDAGVFSDGNEEALLGEDAPPSLVPSASNGDGGAAPSPSGAVTGGASTLDPSILGPGDATQDLFAPDPEIDAVELPTDITYAGPGVLTDDRAVAPVWSPSPGVPACDQIQALTFQRQRTTLGMGVQLSVGIQGAAGLPLSSSVYASCLSLQADDGTPLEPAVGSGSATNALTLVLLQPGETAEENAALHEAAVKLFMSRPRGERVALYRWGASVDQVVDFTSHRDVFSDAVLRRVPLADATQVDSSVAVAAAAAALESVADDTYAWTRNIVVVAPREVAADLIQFQRNVNVIWAVDATDINGFRYVHTTPLFPSDAMGQVSARLDLLRQEGLVTFGLCGDGQARSIQVLSSESGVALPVELKDALDEERSGVCVPGDVATFDYYDTRLVELSFTPEQRMVYDQVLDERDDAVDFEVAVRLTPEHGVTPTLAHLRGGTSLRECADNRVNYSVDLSGGRERFFYPESSGSVGSDEFYLTAMCLDEMYINQLSVDRLMAETGTFVSGVKLVEVRVDGASQGVYLLMEQVKEALIRTHSGLLSVIRRRNGTSEVKFPSADDPDAQAVALAAFEDLAGTVAGLSGPERLEVLDSRLDLHRYMFFTAIQSVLHNGDWGDEPSLYATSTLAASVPSPFFSINGWDPDDVLKGVCAHPENVIQDPFELIGCAEHSLEVAVFASDGTRGDTVLDDEVYALYVDALEVTLDHFTEARVGGAYETTALELKMFTSNPEIVLVMPDWSEQVDVNQAIDAAVTQRQQAFAERRAFLLAQLALYRESH